MPRNDEDDAMLRRSSSTSYSGAKEPFTSLSGSITGQSGSEISITCQNCELRYTGTQYHSKSNGKALCNGCWHENQHSDERLRTLVAELINKGHEAGLRQTVDRIEKDDMAAYRKGTVASQDHSSTEDAIHHKAEALHNEREEKSSCILSQLKDKIDDVEALRKVEVSARMKADIADEEAKELACILSRQTLDLQRTSAYHGRVMSNTASISQSEAAKTPSITLFSDGVRHSTPIAKQPEEARRNEGVTESIHTRSKHNQATHCATAMSTADTTTRIGELSYKEAEAYRIIEEQRLRITAIDALRKKAEGPSLIKEPQNHLTEGALAKNRGELRSQYLLSQQEIINRHDTGKKLVYHQQQNVEPSKNGKSPMEGASKEEPSESEVGHSDTASTKAGERGHIHFQEEKLNVIYNANKEQEYQDRKQQQEERFLKEWEIRAIKEEVLRQLGGMNGNLLGGSNGICGCL
jgi:hypothetical protein